MSFDAYKDIGSIFEIFELVEVSSDEEMFSAYFSEGVDLSSYNQFVSVGDIPSIFPDVDALDFCSRVELENEEYIGTYILKGIMKCFEGFVLCYVLGMKTVMIGSALHTIPVAYFGGLDKDSYNTIKIKTAWSLTEEELKEFNDWEVVFSDEC